MKKLKSLIFRELKLLRKTCLPCLAVAVGLAAMAVLAIFVVSRDLNEGETISGFVLMLSYMCAMTTAGMTEDGNFVFKTDINSGWRNYSFALPVTALEKTIAYFSVKLMAIIAGLILTLISAAAVCTVGGCTISPAVIFCFFICLDSFILFNIVYQSILLRANDMKSLKKFGVIASGAVIAVFAVLEFLPVDSKFEAVLDTIMADMENSTSPTILNKYTELITIPDAAGWIGIALVPVVLAISFVITLKNNERREA